jgi:hypothetical protein
MVGWKRASFGVGNARGHNRAARLLWCFSLPLLMPMLVLREAYGFQECLVMCHRCWASTAEPDVRLVDTRLPVANSNSSGPKSPLQLHVWRPDNTSRINPTLNPGPHRTMRDRVDGAEASF